MQNDLSSSGSAFKKSSTKKRRTEENSNGFLYISPQFRGLCFFEQLLSSQGKSCQVRDRSGVASIVVFSN